MSDNIAVAGEAMGFFHDKGFVSSYRQAAKYAGSKGHVGTLLDVVDARLATPPYEKLDQHNTSHPTPWDEYYTTMSAEYLGQSKRGSKILIVAHGIGPMANEKGVVAAYKWEADDKRRNRCGGRITIDEFHKLEGGHYGPVEIVDFESYLRRYKYPFISILRASEAIDDPVIRARLGARTAVYLTEHLRLAYEYYRQVHGVGSGERHNVDDPFIIHADDPGNCSYVHRKVEDGYAFAHILTMGQIVNSLSRDYGRLPTWSCDVGPYEWWNGTRLIGVREGGIKTIATGPDAHQLLQKHWHDLLEPSGLGCAPDGLFVLMQMPDKCRFTQIEKRGASADTYEPEFRVVSMEKVGELARFYTSSNYPVPIFRYDRREVQVVLPQGANAYELVGDPAHTGGAGSRETCLVQGYRIEIDHTKRLVRKDVLANDYDRMMQLLKVA